MLIVFLDLNNEITNVVFVFQENENYDLRNGTHLANRNENRFHFCSDTNEFRT